MNLKGKIKSAKPGFCKSVSGFYSALIAYRYF